MDQEERFRLVWRKSSYTHPDKANCVEIGFGGVSVVGVRDSKDTAGPALMFSPRKWSAFLTAGKAGAFDRT
ncbi:DUF397 domain-containing protein [Goodfellowiella coeruleoviolacea]|uniref:DUF397 domain-containing protein n=1 Tax=Goodfellowiella coeruleoviolacea TaxID=334858 RepID=A0AAE3GEE8_9PSEU|nr:DUF397 domain-containing protein [Goodfellowiella coeruleoviolacea]MCP2165777.1 protein of unknown function (DUF397) [Goodfellowiella coeruleoviolacea]